MATKTVDILTSQIVEDLANGLTWFKKEDAGFGSIQEKYGASDLNIQLIRKHPKLKDLQPSLTVFRVIDDLTDDTISTTETKGTTTGVAQTDENLPKTPAGPTKQLPAATTGSQAKTPVPDGTGGTGQPGELVDLERPGPAVESGVTAFFDL